MINKQFTRVGSRLSMVVHQIQEQKEHDLAKKVMHLWQKNPFNEQDQNIQNQRIFFILSLDKADRTPAQRKLLLKVFEKEFQYIQKLQEDITHDLLLKLVCELNLEKYNELEVIYHQGEQGRKMYFILEGETVLLEKKPEDQHQEHSPYYRKTIRNFEDLLKIKYYNHQLSQIKRKFDHFGELAIHQRTHREETAISITKSIYATLEYDSYQKILGWLNEQRTEERLDFLNSVPPFKNWHLNEKLHFVNSCEQMKLQNGNFLYKKQMKGDSIYLIQQGEIQLSRFECIEKHIDETVDQLFKSPTTEKIKTIGVYSSGQIIGDYEIYLNLYIDKDRVIRITQAQAKTETMVLRLGISQFNHFINNLEPEGWLNNYLNEKYMRKQNITNGDNRSWLSNRIDKQCSPRHFNTDLSFICKDQSPQQKYYIYHRKNKTNNFQQQLREMIRKPSKELLNPQQLLEKTKNTKSLRKYLSNQYIKPIQQVFDESPSSLKQSIQRIKRKVQNQKDKNDTEESQYQLQMHNISFINFKFIGTSASEISHSIQAPSLRNISTFRSYKFQNQR